MGRGRAPCCQKIGLHKGSWTSQEDACLISYIRKHGHGNWRALPKQAGLLRCGKSCRLRWINYLRPDIKRGNFTKEEEDTIINLHGSLGNKWAKIASCLPGRTDNEIKNVWNTHLKKRIKQENYPKRSPSAATTAWPQVEPTSSLSSGTTFAEGEVLSLHKIEIPIESQLDMWDILDPSLSPNLSYLSPPPAPPVEDDDILIDILWNDANNIEGKTKMVDTCDDGKVVGESGKNWLAYLEEELGLFDEAEAEERVELIRMQEGDSMGSYFHKRPTSSSTSLTKLVDLNSIDA